MTRRCPYCNQTLPEYRFDVKLTPHKARIFDLVRDSGRDGISWNDLFALVYDGYSREPIKGKAREKQARTALKAHIWQINEAIRDSGYRIVGHGRSRSVYRLEKAIFTCVSRETIAQQRDAG
jgi:hypothetical protein